MAKVNSGPQQMWIWGSNRDGQRWFLRETSGFWDTVEVGSWKNVRWILGHERGEDFRHEQRWVLGMTKVDSGTGRGGFWDSYKQILEQNRWTVGWQSHSVFQLTCAQFPWCPSNDPTCGPCRLICLHRSSVKHPLAQRGIPGASIPAFGPVLITFIPSCPLSWYHSAWQVIVGLYL